MMNPNAMDALDATVPSSPVRVVTFDLDNTLWNTGATISAANDALAAFLTTHNIVQSKRTETIMGELFQADKHKYCPLTDNNNNAKSPVLLTELRKDALQQILITDNGYTELDAKEFADKAFQKWMDARYAAIPDNYATNVVAVLEQIYNNDDIVIVGAITDGNSDPRNVPALQPFFDFCVNAEQVGVSKPDKRVYQKAMEMVHAKLSQEKDGTDDSAVDLDDWVGPWWIHVGDDFAKDIVAAKNINLRTIWARELILDKLQTQKVSKAKPQLEASKEETIAAQYNQQPSEEQKLVEFQKKVNSQAVVKMAVGAEDYLTASIQQEFADAVIDNFEELPGVLRQWQEQSQPQSATSTAEEANPIVAAAEVVVESKEQQPNDSVKKEDPETKFCMFCGAKIPGIAVHCPSCGNKQPELSL
ncbi:Inherit from NOG: had-superfamily hydrolase, subfamily ia, variant [Seminavis robusta]|uniref:Inherit from NOG: had-superfamily hydrolase, subfamily ia, variant n=1 Tax=Seminavis robusta TaxID=568900 RepID=A0A9N8EWM7_9STRA|nr:Inherit from NOG: had-superfamily hydrolase, subfamily ia, variant [Seminavis robusta]|eukprot:Sro1978_g309040.1 Inherit from NOG: had-superfamily hydrolase, subfamily ia, variant (418) ;mRNA; f:9778-11198